MKTFSKEWSSSKKPKKQRKFRANAPIHIKKNNLSTNLSKELRDKYKTRNVVIRKGDKVKILRGKYKGKTGKVTTVKVKLEKIYIEGIQTKKQDGSMVDVFQRASNLQITELNTDDKRRFKDKTKNTKKEAKSVNKGEKKNESTSKKE